MWSHQSDIITIWSELRLVLSHAILGRPFLGCIERFESWALLQIRLQEAIFGSPQQRLHVFGGDWGTLWLWRAYGERRCLRLRH